MKNYVFLFLLANVAGSACQPQQTKPAVKKQLVFTATPGGIYHPDSLPTLQVTATLFNPTHDTLNFVSMTCSYEDFFLTDTAAFRVQPRYDCYSNYPTVMSVPPGQRLDQFILVRPVTKDSNILERTLWIGMYLLTPEKKNGFDGIIQQYLNRQKATVIWSNEVELKRFYRRLYK